MTATEASTLETAFGLGALEASGASLPLRRIAIHARLHGPHAHIELEQEFHNDRTTALEVTYVFPLPALGAVSGYTFVVDGVAVRGLLLERGEARERYDAAIAAGRAASTLEEDRPEVLSVRVGNVRPGATARIRIGLDVLLPLADDCAVLRLPLVVGARYVPGEPLGLAPAGGGTSPDTLDAPDASRVTPPIAAGDPGVRVAVLVEAYGFDEVVASHAVAVERRDRALAIRIAEALPDRDVVLRLPLRARDEALFVQDPGGDEGTLIVTACGVALEHEPLPLDVAIVLDRSGSMAGAKIADARRAACAIVECLSARDGVIAIAFDNEVELPLGHALVLPATAAHRRRAIAGLESVGARGGTEMAAALQIALAAFDRRPGRRRAIVLVTDGQVANEDQLVRLATGDHGVRVLAVAIGGAANQGLCQRLAAATGGAWEAAEDETGLGAALERTSRRLLAPALDELEVAVEGAAIVDGTRAPRRPPRLVAGVAAVLGARVRGRPASVALRAIDDRGHRVERTLDVVPADAPWAPRLWARLRVRDLEDELAIAGEPRVEEELLATSLRFGVLSRYTAFVAVDDRGRAVEGPLERVMQPVMAVEPHPELLRRTTTRSGVLKGTYAYLAPEQARGLRLQPAADVFALGVMLHELATLARLFKAASDFDTLRLVTADTPLPGLPPAFAALDPIVRGALARDPARRLPDGAALSRALAGLAVDRAGLAAIAAAHVSHARTPIARGQPGWWLGERVELGREATGYAASYTGPSALPDAIAYVLEEHSELGDPLPLAHPCIARLLGVTHHPRRVHVIERIRGASLRALFHAKQVLTVEQLAAIAIDAASALAAMHAAGVIHRELDPDGFVVRPDGRCVLVALPRAPRGTALPPATIHGLG